VTETLSESPAGNPAVAAPSPWEPMVTLLLGGGIFGVYTLVQVVVFFASLFFLPPQEPGRVSGLQFSLATLISCPVGIALVAAVARSLRGELSVREYLGLRGARPAAVAVSLLSLGSFMALYDLTTRWLRRPTVPDFMVEAYTSARFLPLLYLAVVVAAPLFEELLFRGFLLPGLLRSRLGVTGGILVSSLVFAIPHLQYDLYDMSWVFVLGALLAVVRWQTGSLWLVFGLHALNNLLATLETARLLAQR
jgi:membrane protease YdiL (CAAX protease family)